MKEITMFEMFDYLETQHNRWLGEALDMSLRRPGFEDTPQDQLNIWIAEVEQKAKIIETIIAKLKEVQYTEAMIAGVKKRMADNREAMKGGV